MKTLQRKLLVILCAAVLFGTLTLNASAAFSDTTGHWAAREIQTCADLGVVDGVGGGRFSPSGQVSNAAMVKMITQAIFREDYGEFKDYYHLEMKNYFGSSLQWYSFYMYYAQHTDLLNGVSVDINSSTSCNAAMTRYNMAQIMYNVMASNGIEVTVSQKVTAQAAIGDYANIPANYRDAVLTCYSLGLIKGIDGQFVGGRTMTRAQACTVITRLLDAVGEGAVVTPAPTPTTPVNPNPPVVTPTVKDITVTSKATTAYAPQSSAGGTAAGNVSGTAWTITDNGFGNGYLNNGKPVTEENVVELLQAAEKIWTDGMTWTGTAAPTGNNWWANANGVVINMLSQYNHGNGFGCNGYAAMISTYIFGANNNPLRQTTVDQIRPGDIIIMMSNGKIAHVMVAVSTSNGTYGEATSHRAGYIYKTDGNSGNMVRWPSKYSGPTSPATSGTPDWVVYTRYPA